MMMSNSSTIEAEPPHIVFFPSPGMGHLTTFLRLAAMFASHNCVVTVITIKPIADAAEATQLSSFLSCYPNVKHHELQIIPREPFSYTTNDPFITQVEAINHSVHLLPPLLSSLLQPICAIFSEFVVAATLNQVAAELGIPYYIVSTSSARFYSTVAYLPVMLSKTTAKFSESFEDVKIPGLAPVPKSTIPPSWLDDSPSNHLLAAYLIPNSLSLPKVKGVLSTSFSWFEQRTIDALNDGRVLCDLPPVFPIGPFEPYELEKCVHLPWLDDQPANSVLYVSFGNTIPMSKDQVRELANGLERSALAFLWVLKTNKVGDDENEELRELLGDLFLERTINKGMLIKGCMNQAAILAHPAIGGFINQCEWESVMEAARTGVPMLAWPQQADHKMNAEVVENAELGMWIEEWGWGKERVVTGEEIGERLVDFMRNEKLRTKAKIVEEEAKKACAVGGSSEKVLIGIIKSFLKQKDGP